MEEVAKGKDDYCKRADTEHLDLRNDVGSSIHKCTSNGECLIANKKGGVENHEIFQLKAGRSCDNGHDTAEDKRNNWRGKKPGRDEGKDRMVTTIGVTLKKPT